ncbi:hypothetical protein [Bradyrhizobium guangzhouense]|nr:hypothetical protein [Bradyrhizobium guangzhouense]
MVLNEEDESNPAYRRQMLYFWSQVAKDRDELVDELNRLLSDYETLKSRRESVDAIINQLQEKDTILTSSRFSRVFHNATVLDRAIVGVRSLFTLRPVLATESVIAAIIAVVIGLLFSYFFDSSLRELIHLFSVNGIMRPANAASSSILVAEHAGSIQIYLVIGAAGLVAAAFVWFAVTATLSREATVRRGSMEMVKQVLAFMIGVLTGFFANPH